jgi:hypothetical protein
MCRLARKGTRAMGENGEGFDVRQERLNKHIPRIQLLLTAPVLQKAFLRHMKCKIDMYEICPKYAVLQ